MVWDIEPKGDNEENLMRPGRHRRWKRRRKAEIENGIKRLIPIIADEFSRKMERELFDAVHNPFGVPARYLFGQSST